MSSEVLFCVVYVLFTAPLITSLHKEVSQCTPEDNHSSEDLPFSHSLVCLLLWFSVLLGVYSLVQLTGEKVKNCQLSTSSSLLKPFTRYHVRNEAQHRTNILFLMFFLGVYPSSTMIQFITTSHFVIWFIYFFIVYIILFEICENLTKLTLTSKLLKNPLGLIIVIVSSVVIGGLIYHHMYCAVKGNGFIYHKYFWGVVLMQIIVFMWPSRDISLHIHHYYWPLSLIQLCVFVTSDVSIIGSAMLCAISVHGIAFFGLKPLIYCSKK